MVSPTGFVLMEPRFNEPAQASSGKSKKAATTDKFIPKPYARIKGCLISLAINANAAAMTKRKPMFERRLC